MAAIHSVWGRKVYLEEWNSADTKEVLVVSSYHIVSGNKMPGSAPSKRAMLSRTVFRGKNSPRHVVDLRKFHGSCRSSLQKMRSMEVKLSVDSQ